MNEPQRLMFELSARIAASIKTARHEGVSLSEFLTVQYQESQRLPVNEHARILMMGIAVCLWFEMPPEVRS